MTHSPVRDIGVSVRSRLMGLARSRGEDFQSVLTRYANERLLFRLSSSPYARKFVLKGASLFTLWTGHPHRATRDIDLLGFGDPGEAHIREVFIEVLMLQVDDDGVRFNLDSLEVGRIRHDQEYGGVRVEMIALVTAARIRLQIEVGFGDAITPEATMVDFPSLLDFKPPHLLVYPRETVVAEKLEAMVRLGLSNSRMKDFFDLKVLAWDFDFDGELLVRAIRATFNRRQTLLPKILPVALTVIFADDQTKQAQWSGFIRKAGVGDAGSLADTVLAVAAFAEKPLLAAAHGLEFSSAWRAPGPWGE